MKETCGKEDNKHDKFDLKKALHIPHLTCWPSVFASELTNVIIIIITTITLIISHHLTGCHKSRMKLCCHSFYGFVCFKQVELVTFNTFIPETYFIKEFLKYNAPLYISALI